MSITLCISVFLKMPKQNDINTERRKKRKNRNKGISWVKFLKHHRPRGTWWVYRWIGLIIQCFSASIFKLLGGPQEEPPVHWAMLDFSKMHISYILYDGTIWLIQSCFTFFHSCTNKTFLTSSEGPRAKVSFLEIGDGDTLGT